MGRTERVISILGISAVVICTGATAAYMYINGQSGSKAENNINDNIEEVDIQQDGGSETAAVNNGLNGNAVFTYELYNEMTGTTDTIKGECPFELTGKSLADVKEYYPDWQVTSYSTDNVLLRKNIGSYNDDRYVVGIYEENVAVFYENSEEGIYMLTDIPAASLEQDKQTMLKQGIYVEGKERLNRILQQLIYERLRCMTNLLIVIQIFMDNKVEW